MSTPYKIHQEGATRTVQLRVVRIQNGWLIKAGLGTVFCESMAEVKEAINGILDGFSKESEEMFDE